MVERRLAAILAADVVGYSRLIEADEAGTLVAIKSHRFALIDPKVAQYHGRIVKLMGDGILAEFPSAVEAVQCAVEIQHMMAARNADVPEERRTTYRVGINVGDIVVEDDDIFGDGVNIAARLEGLADPGGICISRPVHTQIKSRLDLTFENLGERKVKNIAQPVTVYRVLLDDKAAALVTPVVQLPSAKRQRRWSTIGAIIILSLLALAGLLWWQFGTPDVEPVSIERMALPLPKKPSIAVLAFDNLTGDQGQEYLSDGFSERIITELSRFSEFFVIARNSSFTYKGKPVNVRQVAEELGVRYVVEGSVQTDGERLRVSVQLIDAIGGKHLWAELYERDLQDIFAIQDDITRTIAATLEENIKLTERARSMSMPAKSLEAYEYERRAEISYLKFTKEGTEEARRSAEKARELDPNYAEAYIRLAWVYINGYRWGWSETHSREESLRLAFEMARKAIELDPRSHRAHGALAGALIQQGDLEQAMVEYDRALELNPNSASVLALSSEALTYLGRGEEAVSRIKTAVRLNPFHPDWYLWDLTWAQYYAEQYEDALASMKKMNTMPNPARRTLAAIYVRLGRLEEAQAVIEKFLEKAPEYDLGKLRLNLKDKFRNPADAERFIEDLRKAGLPE